MRFLILAGLVAGVLTTAACGAYSFPPGAAQTGHVAGSVTVYPCAPVQQAGQQCAGKVGSGLAIIFTDSSQTTTTIIVEANGTYAADLAAGTWKVSFKGVARIMKGPDTIAVPAGGSVVADYVIDSGIRLPGPPPAA